MKPRSRLLAEAQLENRAYTATQAAAFEVIMVCLREGGAHTHKTIEKMNSKPEVQKLGGYVDMPMLVHLLKTPEWVAWYADFQAVNAISATADAMLMVPGEIAREAARKITGFDKGNAKRIEAAEIVKKLDAAEEEARLVDDEPLFTNLDEED